MGVGSYLWRQEAYRIASRGNTVPAPKRQPSRDKVLRSRSRSTRVVTAICLMMLAYALFVVAKRTRGGASMQGLTEPLNENSGLAYIAGSAASYWSIADSGSAPVLYGVSTDGKITGAYLVDVPRNVDWEDIASDGKKRLFIADFGDNFSKRSDHSIIEIELDKTGTPKAVPAAVYPFAYPRPERSLTNDFDAESLVYLGGQLYILTKRRSDTRTKMYRINADPARSGQVQRAKYLGAAELSDPKSWFHFGQMATAAALDGTARRLAVLTYRSVLVFEDLSLPAWNPATPRPPAQSDARMRRLLSRAPKRWALKVGQTKQCEGIEFKGNKIMISNESGAIFELSTVVRGGY